MTSAVAELFEKALLLSPEERARLLEAIWEGEGEVPEDDFMAVQASMVAERMENVESGRSRLVAAADAHRMVRESLHKANS